MSEKIAIAYGLGAASPLEIAEACDAAYAPVFLIDAEDAHTASVVPILRSLGRVLDARAGVDRLARELLNLDAIAVTTYAESMIRLVAELAPSLGSRYLSGEAAAAVTDKVLQRSILQRARVPSARSRHATSPAEFDAAIAEIGLPAVVKPRFGAGSVNTFIVTSDPETETVRSLAWDGDLRRTEYVVEEMLRGGSHPAASWLGDYVSVDSVVIEGESHSYCISDKPPLAWPFRETGMIVPSSLGDSDITAVRDVAEAAVRACGIRNGATHTEIKLTPDGPRVIEVNGRVGGSVATLVNRLSGFDPIRAAMDAAAGRAAPPGRVVYQAYGVQYLVPAPPAACVVTKPPSLDALRSVPGVFQARVHVERGSRVDWRTGTLGRVATVWAEVTDLTAAATVYDMVAEAVDATAAYG